MEFNETRGIFAVWQGIVSDVNKTFVKTKSLTLPNCGNQLLVVTAFLPARRYASAGLCDSDVSVRPSVTRRYYAYQSESRIVKCIPSDSPITLVSG